MPSTIADLRSEPGRAGVFLYRQAAIVVTPDPRDYPMIRPDHVWFFFTVVLLLALAMSVPRRKAEPQSTVAAYGLGQSIR